MSSLTVVHGFQPSAGQPGALARALRSNGVDATSVVVGPNKFGFSTDLHFPSADPRTMRSVLTDIASKASVLHIHAVTPFFTRGRVSFPMGTDLLALKAAGTKIVMHFRGSEIRMASLFKSHSPYNYVDDDPEGVIARFPETWQRDYLSMCRSLCDAIIVTDPELQTYVPDAEILHRTIDLCAWQQKPLARKLKPLVVHAPSRPGVKGTSHVMAAVHELQKEGLEFEFRLVQGLTNSQAHQIYAEADIVVDQLRIGWYGVLAVEAMALGRPVISYIRDDLTTHFGERLPLANANPDTFKDVLRRLLLSPTERDELALAGRAYCENTHDSRRVAERAASVYRNVLSCGHEFAIGDYLNENHRHEAGVEELIKAAKALGARNAKKKAKSKSTARNAVSVFPAGASYGALLGMVAQRATAAYKIEGLSQFARNAPRRARQLLQAGKQRLRWPYAFCYFPLVLDNVEFILFQSPLF